MRWFRLYSSVLHDPKVQRLSPELFKHWIYLLCLASDQDEPGILPSVDDIAFALRLKPSDVAVVMTQLEHAGLIDRTPQGRCLRHNWPPDDGGPRLSEWRILRATVFARDDYTCQYCGLRGVSLQCDHIIPVSRGGSNDLDNLATACKPCNQSKCDKTLEEWRR